MKKLVVVLALLLVTSSASADIWCDQWRASHGHSVSAGAMCAVQMLFDLLGGW